MSLKNFAINLLENSVIHFNQISDMFDALGFIAKCNYRTQNGNNILLSHSGFTKEFFLEIKTEKRLEIEDTVFQYDLLARFILSELITQFVEQIDDLEDSDIHTDFINCFFLNKIVFNDYIEYVSAAFHTQLAIVKYQDRMFRENIDWD